MCHGKKVYNYKSWNSHHHEHLPINFSSWQKGIPLKMDCGLPSSKLKWLWKIYRTSPVKNISKLRVAKKGQHRPPMAAKTRVKLPSSIGLGWPLPCAMRVKVISASSAFTEPRMVTGWMDGWHCDASFFMFLRSKNRIYLLSGAPDVPTMVSYAEPGGSHQIELQGHHQPQ